MATKTISITDDVYEGLKALKAHDESFSEELRRLLRTKTNLMDFAGMWKDAPDVEIKTMKRSVDRLRKGSRLYETAKLV